MGFVLYDSPVMETRFDAAEDHLIKSIEGNQDHMLCQPFPPTLKRHYFLRPQTHNFELPTKDDTSFISHLNLLMFDCSVYNFIFFSYLSFRILCLGLL